VTGPHHDRVIAFTRAHQGAVVLVVCGRHFTAIAPPAEPPLGARWADTALHPDPSTGRRFRDVFSGRTVEATAAGTLDVRDLFAHLPVAMLEALP
jgi:maltooligosyltrehalose synthase